MIMMPTAKIVIASIASIVTCCLIGLICCGCRSSSPSPSSSSSTSMPSGSSAPSTGTGTGSETVAVWTPLRWDMDRAAATDALRKAGYNPSVRDGKKGPGSTVSADVGTSQLTVYFDDRGAMNQIVLITETLPEQDSRTVRTKLDARFGATKDDRRSIEKRWKLAGDAHISARVGQEQVRPGGDDKQVERTWSLHQERGRGSATGPVGWGDLAWGANAADVDAKLKAAGFTTRAQTTGVDPCKLPNAPPNCKTSPFTELELNKTEGAFVTTGHVSIPTGAGLTQVVVTKKGFTDQTKALAELTAIETTNGLPSSIERSQHTTWHPGTGEVTLDVRQRDGKWSAIEAYRPMAR